MNVRNKKCIRRLSYRTLRAAGRKNLIAIAAIALTTILFTSLFSIVLTISKSYEEHTFRQVGGYSHGAFKEVTEEEAGALNAHPLVKASGVRTVIGLINSGAFAKKPAEISFMDKNAAKWSWCVPKAGRLPEKENEIYMDEDALQRLGIPAEPGQEITLTYQISDKTFQGPEQTDTFLLSGIGSYDEALPVHYINVSKAYADRIADELSSPGHEAFRTDLNIMLYSSFDIEGQLRRIARGAGYQTEDPSAGSYLRYGVNWGYISTNLLAAIDAQTVLAILSFLVLILFTGFLIIHNLFRISVAGDIRFYGLLKTIGVTPRQLRTVIRKRALFLSAAGIPLGLITGFLLSAALMPYILRELSLGNATGRISTSPLIFIGAALFSLVTVLLSCKRPGRIAGAVSPVEAVRYTEGTVRRKRRRSFLRGIPGMAAANLSRSVSKTVLVLVSLSLSVVLFNILFVFVGGFDMEKYLSNFSCADFVVSNPDYFGYAIHGASIDDEAVAYLNEHIESTLSGSGYTLVDSSAFSFMDPEIYELQVSAFPAGRPANPASENGLLRANLQVEGLDDALFSKLKVLEGDLAPLFDPESNAIAIRAYTDDFGMISSPEEYPKVGDSFPVEYAAELLPIDTRTGAPADESTPAEFVDIRIDRSYKKDYTVCALVDLPYGMSLKYTYLVGYTALLPLETLRADAHTDVRRVFCLFDTPDEATEARTETFLQEFTKGDSSEYAYESKAILRKNFEGMRNMFLLLGSVLCFIVALVGILNFFNAVMTGILARKKEFAVLSAVGLTNRQLRRLLICEGLFYALGASTTAFLLALIMTPVSGFVLSKMFWFYTYRFRIAPVLALTAVFLLLGILIPAFLCRSAARESVTERLRSEG